MASTPNDPVRFSLRRWSQRKRDAARHGDATRDADAAGGAVAVRQPAQGVAAQRTQAAAAAPAAMPARQGEPPNAAAAGDSLAPAEIPGGAATLAELPPLDSLTIDSDYAAFMRPGVDDSLKCGALKKLFSDPRFNVMDGLDVYIDDYSKPSPIDPAIVRTLMQARYIFNPPKTRVNAQGHVEDVPEPLEGDAVDAEPPEPGQPGAEVVALPNASLAAAEPVEATAPIAVAPLPALQHEPAPAADVTAAGDGAEKVKPKLP